MRYSRLFSIAAVAVLMVVMASCTVVRDGYGEYEDGYSGRRVYHGNVYGGNTIIVERDPFTGHLYRVSPYGYYSPFDTYGYNYYPYNYDRRYYNRGGSSNGKPRPSIPKDNKPNVNKQKFEDARRKVLGDKRQ